MDNKEALTYASKEPDVLALQQAYDNTLLELSSYIDQCRQNYDDRRNYWPGKSHDMRKQGSDAFPWEGASDLEAHVIDERINAYVALFMTSLNRANIRAYPVESGDMSRAKMVSGFLKWMVSSYIPRFRKEMELCANFLLERGIAITYVGWQKEERTYLQKLDLEQLAQADPALAQSVMDGSADDVLINMLKSVYPNVNDARAKRALKELRKTGETEIPVSRTQVDAPLVQTLSPDGDFFFPPYVTDPQRAPYCFWRTFFTPQELLNKVVTEGWDEEWVEYVIERFKGVNVDSVDVENNGRRSTIISDSRYEAEDLIEIVYGYQRLIDRIDGSEGIYCTVFHKEMSTKKGDTPKYAKHELLNGYEDYPVVVTRLFEESKRLYDTQAFPELLRGNQMQVKIERDSRVDRNSMATLPPLMHPIGNAPKDWRPGGFNGYRRAGEVMFGPTPQFPSGSIEMEQTMLKVADGLVGLDGNRIESNDIRRNFVEKFLYHTNEVLKMTFKCFQRFGPDSIWFRVTGDTSQQFTKGDPDENFDIVVSYDVLNNDPETMESKLQALVSLTQLDKNGLIDINSLVATAAAAIDPVMADGILQPQQEAQQQIVKQVTDDLAKIYAGIEMPARPNGAQVALQTIQQYAQQPDVAERLQQDESFAARLEKYVGQYTMQMQQAQNAEIGRIGTEPAQMGGVQTQGMYQ